MASVCMVVDNAVTNDIRVMKEARVLAASGYDVTAVGFSRKVMGFPSSEHIDGVNVIRVSGYGTLDPTPRVLKRRKPGWSVEEIIKAVARRIYFPLRRICLRRLRFRKHRRRMNVLRTIAGVDADVYHAHDYPSLRIVMKAMKGSDKVIIYDTHELYFDRYPSDTPGHIRKRRHTLDRFREKRLAGKVNLVITVSEPIAEILQSRLKIAKPKVIMNAVEGVQSVNPARRFPVKGKILVHSGNITYGRNLENLVRAMATVPDDVHLVLLGTARQATLQSLLGIIGELKLEKRVHILEAVSQDALIPTLAQADAGVVLFARDALNYRLGLPNKFFEYVAAGLPIVAGGAEAIRELIKKYDIGIICDETSTTSIAEAIASIVDKDANREFRGNLERAAQELAWEVEAKKLLYEYSLLTQNHYATDTSVRKDL